MISRPDGFGALYFLIYLLITAFDLLFGFGRRNLDSPASLGLILLSMTLSTLITWALLIPTRKVILVRNFAQRHPSVMVVTLSFLVLLSGVLMTVVLLSFGLETPFTNSFLSLDQLLFQVAVLLFLNMIFAKVRDFSKASRELRETELSLLLAEEAGKESLKNERQRIIFETRSQIGSVLGKSDFLPVADYANELANSSENLIRPISHELMSDAASLKLPKSPRQKSHELRNTLKLLSTKPVLNPLLISSIASFFALRVGTVQSSELLPAGSEGVRVSGDLVSVGLFLVQTAIVFLLFWLASKLFAKFLAKLLPLIVSVWLRWLAQVLFSFVLSVVVTLGIEFAIDQLRFVSDFKLIEFAWYDFLIPVLFGLAFELTQTIANARGKQLLAELETRRQALAFSVARINEELLRQRKALAKVLHGRVRSALIAGAIQLRNAIQGSAETEKLVSSINQSVRQVLDGLDSESKKDIDYEEEIALIEQTWGGVSEITWEYLGDSKQLILSDNNCQPTLVDIIGEACSNAVLHGKATKLDMKLEALPNNLLRLSVRDNGRSDTTARKSGLGDGLFNQVSVFWSRTTDALGTELVVEIPLLANNQKVPG